MTTAQDITFGATRSFELSARSMPEGVIEGLASPFGGPEDSHGTTFRRGAYAASLRRYQEAGRLPAMLWDHDLGAVIGRWERVEERSDGLHVQGRLNLRTERGREAFEHVRAGDISGISVGFIPREMSGSAYVEVDLKEISLVAIPSADDARVLQVRSIKSRAELRDLLLRNGLPRAAAEKISCGGFPALNRGNHDPEDLEALLREMRSVSTALGRVLGMPDGIKNF